jgi:hypothetical protein
MAIPPKVLCLSFYFSTDRILFHSSFFPRLTQFAEPAVWSTAVKSNAFPTDHEYSKYYQPYPNFDHIPHRLTVLRHFLDYLWEYKGISKSRESFWRLRRKDSMDALNLQMHRLARFIAPLKLENFLERQTERLMLKYGINAGLSRLPK